VRTLIVDDEPIARQVLREELAGFDDVTVVASRDGEEALAGIARLQPDLVLLDCKCPPGWLRGDPSPAAGRLPAIVIRHATTSTPPRLRGGSLDYLLKPVGASASRRL